MREKASKIRLLLASGVLVLFIYILLHELGHLIVMLSAGATITEFSIVTAHVSGTGGEYTNLSDLWLHANGTLLPVLTAYIYMLFYKSNSEKLFYRFISYMVGLVSTASMFSWLIIPFMYMGGNAPANHDVTKFVYNFSHYFHPLIVSAVAAIMIGIGIAIMIKKRMIHDFIVAVR